MDRKRLIQLIFTFEDRIRRFFARQLSQWEDIDDLTQDVICALIDSHERFRGDSSPATWVYAICRNHLHTFYRKKKRSRELTLRLLYETRPRSEDLSRAVFDIACERLNVQQRKLYIEFYRNRFTVREIAEQMQKPAGTVKYLLYELRRDLKKILG